MQRQGRRLNNKAGERGNLSVDFLCGFTIFIIAFIWVASMVSGILVGLQGHSIDYEAVAYRTGVILVEDPGWPASPPWEFYPDGQKYNISRFGMAIAKDTPGILLQDKVSRFFCSTFIYPDDYHTRAIFGDYPYNFNISVRDVEKGTEQSVGPVLPEGYGYIRRLVKIKGDSNATINLTYMIEHDYNKTAIPSDFNVSHHEFSILVNMTKLQQDVKDPAYQIDPSREQIMINITNLSETRKLGYNDPSVFPGLTEENMETRLWTIKVYKQEGTTLSMVRLFTTPYIDGIMKAPGNGCFVKDNVSLIINPRSFDIMQAGYSKVYINLTFDMTVLPGSCSGPTPCPYVNSSFLNNTFTAPFEYDYDAADVTQPKLRDGVVEVAVW
jgi:hypothetical protein